MDFPIQLRYQHDRMADKPKTKTPAKKPGFAKRAVVPKKTGSTSITATDPLLQTYLREIHKYPLLSRDEEKALALDFFKTQDREALQRLVTSNLRFVVKIAYEYVHYRMKLMDLIQEGNMGLVKAIKEFNPYKDVRITTYAVWWIRSYIQDALLRNHSLVKIGTTQAQKRLFYRLRAEQAKLEQMGIAPEDRPKLLAANLDVKEKEITEMQQRMGSADLSLNAPMDADEKRKHIDHLTDPAEAIDDAMGDAEQMDRFKMILKEFAGTLEGREKVIFEQRLISENPSTLQEIGDKYGVSKERARQIEEQIKNRLRDYVKTRYPDYDLLTPG